MRPSYSTRGRGEATADMVVHARLHCPQGDLDPVLDRVRIGLAMTDDAHAAHAQQWRAAVLGVVEVLERPGELLRVEVGTLGEHADERGRDALVELEEHVADEAVADDDVDRAA